MNDVIQFKLSKIDADITTVDAQIKELLDKKKFLEQLRDYAIGHSVNIPEQNDKTAVANSKKVVNGAYNNKVVATGVVSMNDRIINIVDGMEKTTQQVVQEYANAVGKSYSEVNRSVSKAIYALYKRGKVKTRPITRDNPKAGSYIVKA